MPIKPKKNHPVNHHTLPPFSGQNHKYRKKFPKWKPVPLATVHDEVVYTVPSDIHGLQLKAWQSLTLGSITMATKKPEPNPLHDYVIMDTEMSFSKLDDWYANMFPDCDAKYKEAHPEPSADMLPGERRMRASDYVDAYLETHKFQTAGTLVGETFTRQQVLTLMTRFAQNEVALTLAGRKQTEESKQAARIDALRQMLDALPSTDRDGRLFREEEA